MADRFLSPPRGDFQSQGSRRTLRDRQSEHFDEIDRSEVNQEQGAARLVVQVFNDGHMPATSEKIFFTHPVLVTGTESEGSPQIYTVDADTTVPVVVLGKAPSVGDYLTAYLCSGRWVTEQLSKSGTNCYTTTCLPCGIPRGDLTIAWTNATTGDGSATLAYNGTQWTATCVDNGLKFKLLCNAGSVELQAIYTVSGVCPTGPTTFCSNKVIAPKKLTLSSSVCSPFSLTFDVTNADCPVVFGMGNTQFVVTGPNDSFGACPVCFHVAGCFGAPVAGATVDVKDGMIAVVSGTTNATGDVILDVGGPGTYNVTTSAPTYITNTISKAIKCGDQVNLTLAQASKICVTGCTGLPVEGATVALPGRGLSDTTDAMGCVYFDINVGSAETITVTKSRYASFSGTRTPANCTTISISLGPATGYMCAPCFDAPIPTTLTVIADGVTTTITAVGGGVPAFPPFCMTKPAVPFIAYPPDVSPIGCGLGIAADPCTTSVSSAGARFTFSTIGSACTLSEEVWGGTDCSSADPTCTGLTHGYYSSTCATFAPPNQMTTSFCVSVWGTFVACHYAQLNHISEIQSLAGFNTVPVNLTYTFVGQGGQSNLFSTVNIIE